MTGCRRLTGLALVAALVAALAGCTAGGTSPSHAGAPDSGSSSPAPTAPVTATTHAPTAMLELPASPPPVTFKPGDSAVVVADAVRARNGHSLEDSRFIPMLAKGSCLLILEGPKHGSGYHWYRIELINATLTGVQGMDQEPQGIWGSSIWVPVASRDGDAWLRHGRARCPEKPATALEVYATPRGARITCFSGVPITIQAQVVANEVGCDYDPGMALRPRWLDGARVTVSDGSDRYALLATPRGSVPGPPCPPFDTLLYVDPASTHPRTLRVGDRLAVTGEFDHPAAAECTWKWGEEPWTSTDACRYWFVATRIVRSR